MSRNVPIIAMFDRETGLFKPKYPKYAKRLVPGFDDKQLVLLEVKTYKEKRSLDFNAFYWGPFMGIILDFHFENQGVEVTGDEMHIFHCTRIMGMKPKLKEIMGETVITMQRARTSKMSNSEFNTFVSTIRVYWEERGCDFSQLDKDNFDIE